MRAIRIQAFQNLPSYKKPGSFQLRETYPLPPYSSVIGMVHCICGLQSYVDMEVSVQGSYYSAVSEQITVYEFGYGTKYEKGRHNVKVSYNGDDYGITRGIGNVELLTDVNLMLHIKPSDQTYVNSIYNGLINPQTYPSLGRWEDLIRIDSVEIVEVKEHVLKEYESLKYDAYIPSSTPQINKGRGIGGTVYRINKKYSIDPVSGIRVWDEQVEVRYVPKNTRIRTRQTVSKDTNGDLVFFA